MVVNVAALDLGLGSGGFDVVHVNLTRGLERAAECRRRARDEAQLHLAPAPRRPGRAPRRRAWRFRRPWVEKAPLRCRCSVLPLHGHLAPAAWAAAQAPPGLRVGYVQTGGGALPGSLSRDVAELRERGPALRPPHRRARPTAASTRRSRSPAPSTRPPHARLGRGPRRARPGDHRLRDAARPRRHGRPRHRSRRARARAADAALAAPLLRRPARAPPRRQPPHADRDVAAARPGRGAGARPARRSRSRSSRRPAAGATRCARSRSTSPATRPRGCRRGRWAAGSTRTRSSSPRRWPRAPPCAARDEPRPARTTRHGCRGQAVAGAPARRPAGRRPLRGPGPRLPLLPGAGAGPLAQHAERLPHRPPPVRGVPRRARRRRAHGAARRHRRVPRRPRDRQRPPACSASTIHRKAACLRSFYKHLRRDELIADDPTAVLSAPRRAKKLPQVLNYSEVQKLLAAPRGDEPTVRATGPCSR